MTTARVPSGLSPQPTGLTSDDLVARVKATGCRTDRRQMVRLLDELRAAGHAEDVHGLWRMTIEVEEEFGVALRAITRREDEGGGAPTCTSDWA